MRLMRLKAKNLRLKEEEAFCLTAGDAKRPPITTRGVSEGQRRECT